MTPEETDQPEESVLHDQNAVELALAEVVYQRLIVGLRRSRELMDSGAETTRFDRTKKQYQRDFSHPMVHLRC
jgi:hypothetical protein